MEIGDVYLGHKLQSSRLFIHIVTAYITPFLATIVFQRVDNPPDGGVEQPGRVSDKGRHVEWCHRSVQGCNCCEVLKLKCII